MACHFPASGGAIHGPFQNPHARADGPERLVYPGSFYAVVYERTVLAQWNHFVVTERIRLPRFEFGALQHLANGWRRHRRKDKVAGEYHDGVAREQRDKVSARAAESSPCLVFERANGGRQRRIRERRSCHGCIDEFGCADNRRLVLVSQRLSCGGGWE